MDGKVGWWSRSCLYGRASAPALHSDAMHVNAALPPSLLLSSPSCLPPSLELSSPHASIPPSLAFTTAGLSDRSCSSPGRNPCSPCPCLALPTRSSWTRSGHARPSSRPSEGSTGGIMTGASTKASLPRKGNTKGHSDRGGVLGSQQFNTDAQKHTHSHTHTHNTHTPHTPHTPHTHTHTHTTNPCAKRRKICGGGDRRQWWRLRQRESLARQWASRCDGPGAGWPPGAAAANGAVMCACVACECTCTSGRLLCVTKLWHETPRPSGEARGAPNTTPTCSSSVLRSAASSSSLQNGYHQLSSIRQHPEWECWGEGEVITESLFTCSTPASSHPRTHTHTHHLKLPHTDTHTQPRGTSSG